MPQGHNNSIDDHEVSKTTGKIVASQLKYTYFNIVHPIYNENAETHLNLADIKKFKFKPYELRQSSIPIEKKSSI